MRLRNLFLFASLAGAALCNAGDVRPLTLKVVATADTDEVHPDSAFDVTLTLENPTNTVESIRIPDCGWDKVWRSSNRHVTWDAWDCDGDDQVTVEIQPHDSYVFLKPLRMFVDGISKETKLDFKMGFKTSAFGKVLWSDSIKLNVTP